MSTNSSNTFNIGGDLQVNRLGYGAMRLTGPGEWGPPSDKKEALAVLRRAVELGVNFIDTADSYGPNINEELIAEALYPYPPDLVISTKGGYVRSGPHKWASQGDPRHLRQALEGSLRRLKLDRIDLYQFHVPDSRIPIEESVGALAKLQQEGKIRHIGISNVSISQLRKAQTAATIVSVQNSYNVVDRFEDDIVDLCTEEDIAFLPYHPLSNGRLQNTGAIAEVVANHNATPSQIALAWLLHRTPVMIPIPGTTSVKHLEENMAASNIKLTNEEFELLSNY